MCGHAQRVWGGHWRGQPGLGMVDTVCLPVLVSCPLTVTITCPQTSQQLRLVSSGNGSEMPGVSAITKGVRNWWCHVPTQIPVEV